MEIIKFGGGRRLDICCEMLSERLCERLGRIVVLPIPTTRDGIFINGSDILLESVYDSVTDGTLVAGYGIPDTQGRRIEELGGTLYDAGADEIFLLENAKITAHGALGRLLGQTERDVSELFVGIIGYGRIGSALAELLMFLGARVRIYSTDENKLFGLATAGAEARRMDAHADIFDLDALINTAPARLLSDSVVSEALDRKMTMIELASGKNFSDERVCAMPSIPDRMYPLSAGRLYAECIIGALPNATPEKRG